MQNSFQMTEKIIVPMPFRRQKESDNSKVNIRQLRETKGNGAHVLTAPSPLGERSVAKLENQKANKYQP